jgi:oligopeptide/dipeptide ABC transporter ATP-binding protein
MTPVLDIGELCLSFRTDQGPAQVLDRVELAVRPGEIVGLVGETGCGKTSLVRAILGTLPERQACINGGHIRLDGTDVLRDARAARHARGRFVTFVPQDPLASLNPLFRIGTQISDLMRWTVTSPRRPRFCRSQRSQEDAALAMLDAVQLPHPRAVMRKYPHQLSGGQRQRVLIAMALLPRPRIIVADEPTAALDVTIQAQILTLFRRIAGERGVAILFATHNLGAVWEICDRIVVMYAGQTVEIAPRDAFFTSPRHPYTRLLLASRSEIRPNGVGIPGDVPSPLLPPAGCRFNPRCPRATEICRRVRPPLLDWKADHRVACHHPWPVAS